MKMRVLLLLAFSCSAYGVFDYLTRAESISLGRWLLSWFALAAIGAGVILNEIAIRKKRRTRNANDREDKWGDDKTKA